MDSFFRKNSSERRQWSRRNSRRNERGDNAMAIDAVESGPRDRRPSKQQLPRRISNMSDSSDNKQPRQVPFVAAPRLGSSMQPRRISSMSMTDDRPTLARAQSLGQALLEEWPRRNSIMEVDDMNPSPKPKKEVKFAEYSSIHMYPIHEVEKKKSYKSADIKMFKAKVNRDASRVAELIAICPLKGGNAVCHLIDIGALTAEDLIGIDHLLCGEDASKKIAFDRFTHSKLVTRKQHDLYVEQLAYVASKRSSRNVEKAIMRARLAEMETKIDVCTQEPMKISGERRGGRSPAA